MVFGAGRLDLLLGPGFEAGTSPGLLSASTFSSGKCRACLGVFTWIRWEPQLSACMEQASQKFPCIALWAGRLGALLRMPLCWGPRARPATLNADALPGLGS